ncbi:M48 family metallopeptidase [Roseobacteraceae bacterium S113]
MAPQTETRGQFFDGHSAARHEVDVRLSEDRRALLITGASLAEPLRWPLPDLRATSDKSSYDQLVLTVHAQTQDESPRDPARLIVTDRAFIAWIQETRPNLHRRDVAKGTGTRVLRNLGLAVGAFVLILFVILPAMANTLARIIPLEREIAFGKTVTGQMERMLGGSELGALSCEAPAGRAALDAMTARLVGARALEYDLNIQVFDHDMVNAFAAPGGQIVLMRGLIDNATGADAVAAVLAHEIAHVVNRDATRAALRTAGSAGILSLVLGDVTGGTILVFVGEQVMNSSYSREAETAADLYALEMLAEAGVSAEGMGTFFDQIEELQEGFRPPEYLSSHPHTGDRGVRARDFAAGQSTTSPVMSESDWQALREICG